MSIQQEKIKELVERKDVKLEEILLEPIFIPKSMNLHAIMNEFRKSSGDIHDELKRRVDKHGEEIDEHERRIIHLEDWKKTKEE